MSRCASANGAAPYALAATERDMAPPSQPGSASACRRTLRLPSPYRDGRLTHDGTGPGHPAPNHQGPGRRGIATRPGGLELGQRQLRVSRPTRTRRQDARSAAAGGGGRTRSRGPSGLAHGPCHASIRPPVTVATQKTKKTNHICSSFHKRHHLLVTCTPFRAPYRQIGSRNEANI